MDDQGHGTHVAGIIGAVGNNSLGVAGVNWNVKILPCKFLDALGSGQPDLVLLDIGLPGMDGYEVARRLRQAEGGGQLTLVALTGFSQEKDRARAREAGFDYHMVKPVDPGDLEALVAYVATAGSESAEPGPR